MELILGGAQIADSYGISNKKKEINSEDLEKILNYKNKIKIIDTANSYKGSLEKISKLYKDFDIKINLKINIGNGSKLSKKFFERLNKSFGKLKKKKIYSIMVHDTNNFLNLYAKEKVKILNYLKKLKKQKKIEKFGFSIYNTNELDYICKIVGFDIIQFPGNIFDQEVLQNKKLISLKKRGIELHVRSIFLQGLIFITINKAKEIAGVNSLRLNKFYSEFKSKKERIFHCINFIKNQKNIDKIVIGLTSFKEFKEVVKIFETKLKRKKYSKFKIQDQNIIKPFKWKRI